jgi:hypothetical protein
MVGTWTYTGNPYKIYLSENLRGRDHFGDLGVDGRIILNGCLNCILRGFEMLSTNRRA